MSITLRPKWGTDGDDFLFAKKQSAHAWIFGLEGNDQIEDLNKFGKVQGQQDWYDGGEGNDLLISHAGWDKLEGDLGNDYLAVEKMLDNTSSLRMIGGKGDDTAIIVTDDLELLDFDTEKKQQWVDAGDFKVKLNGVEHVDYMTSEEFADFKATWNTDSDVLL